MFGLFKQRRRARVRQRPFPEEWLEIVKRHLPYYHVLSEDEKAELRGHIQVFLDEKRFEGCGGQEITDEIRVTIAAQACVLLLHRDTDYYPGLKSILVYPFEYFAPSRQRRPDGAVVEGHERRLGESWSEGAVVLSWNDVNRGVNDARDGENLVLHEFAHQLDGESGSVEGAPELPCSSMYVAWARVLGNEYQRLVDDLRHRRGSILRSYAASSPAEFFAVVTEMFFERPFDLRQRHPELYQQFVLFYRQDPAEKIESAQSRIVVQQ